MLSGKRHRFATSALRATFAIGALVGLRDAPSDHASTTQRGRGAAKQRTSSAKRTKLLGEQRVTQRC